MQLQALNGTNIQQLHTSHCTYMITTCIQNYVNIFTCKIRMQDSYKGISFLFRNKLLHTRQYYYSITNSIYHY